MMSSHQKRFLLLQKLSLKIICICIFKKSSMSVLVFVSLMSYQSGFIPLVVIVGVLLYAFIVLFFFLTYDHQRSSTPSIAETTINDSI